MLEQNDVSCMLHLVKRPTLFFWRRAGGGCRKRHSARACSVTRIWMASGQLTEATKASNHRPDPKGSDPNTALFRTRRDNSRRRFDDIDSEGKKRPIRSFEIHPLLPRTSQDAKTRRGSKEVTLGWYGGRPRRRGRPQLYIFNAAHAHMRTQEIGPVRPFVRLTD